jgi:hypothetical protein
MSSRPHTDPRMWKDQASQSDLVEVLDRRLGGSFGTVSESVCIGSEELLRSSLVIAFGLHDHPFQGILERLSKPCYGYRPTYLAPGPTLGETSSETEDRSMGLTLQLFDRNFNSSSSGKRRLPATRDDPPN